jgi:GH24 family phage-related lysozyme (muramidase)
MPMTFGHIPPDMTLTKAERDADRAAWDALEAENKKLRAVLEVTQTIVADGALVGFLPLEGTWADRLFRNQWDISQALKTG